MFFFTQLYKTQFSSNFNHVLAISILSFYPITFFFGNALINTSIIILDLLLIFEIFKKKDFVFFKNTTFYSMIGLWFILLLNLLFSIDPINSLSRSIGFIRYIFFVMAIIYYFNLNNRHYLKIILFSWAIIFLILNLDLIYEFYFGQNILGIKSYMPGRLASFFNDELIAGHYYYGFSLIILSYILTMLLSKKFHLLDIKIKTESILYFCVFFFILISFLIGERSNFIKTSIMIILFVFILEKNFINKKNIKKKLVLIAGLLAIFILTISLNHGFKIRFYHQLILPFVKNPISYIMKSDYGHHYSSGLKIFSENKLYGVGLKNYRIESRNKNHLNSSLHPHQAHIEILSELGLIGYISFLLFFIINFRGYQKMRVYQDNYFQLAGFLFIITSFIPLLPSGSFFTTHGAALFWMNFAFTKLKTK